MLIIIPNLGVMFINHTSIKEYGLYGGDREVLLSEKQFNTVEKVLFFVAGHPLYINYDYFDNSPMYSWSKYYSWPPLLFISLIIPFLIIASLLSKDKKPIITFCMIFIILIIFLSKGVNAPFGDLFLKLLDKYPLLYMFRDPYGKFGMLIPFLASLLIAYSLAFIKKYKIILFLAGLSIILLAWPMITGDLIRSGDENSPSARISDLPQDYYNVAKIINSDKSYGTVISLPTQKVPLQFLLLNGSLYSSFDPIRLLTYHPFTSNLYSYSDQKIIEEIIDNGFNKEELEKISPKFILFNKNLKDKDLFIDQNKSKEILLKLNDKIDLVYSSENIDLYQFKENFDRFNLVGEVDDCKIKRIDRLASYKYEISFLGNCETEEELIFWNTYNKEWIITSEKMENDFNIIQTLIANRFTYSKEYDSKYNSFNITPKSNKITVYYKIQIYYDLIKLMYILITLICLVGLLFSIFSEIKRKKVEVY